MAGQQGDLARHHAKFRAPARPREPRQYLVIGTAGIDIDRLAGQIIEDEHRIARSTFEGALDRQRHGRQRTGCQTLRAGETEYE